MSGYGSYSHYVTVAQATFSTKNTFLLFHLLKYVWMDPFRLHVAPSNLCKRQRRASVICVQSARCLRKQPARKEERRCKFNVNDKIEFKCSGVLKDLFEPTSMKNPRTASPVGSSRAAVKFGWTAFMLTMCI